MDYKSPHRFYWRIIVDAFLIVLFGLLQFADGVVTFLGLQTPHIEEANPLANLCFQLLGQACSITVIKLLGLGFILFLFLERRKMNSRWITTTLASGVAFSTWALLHNVALLISD